MFKSPNWYWVSIGKIKLKHHGLLFYGFFGNLFSHGNAAKNAGRIAERLF
jgi:hypothetical protein